MTWLEEIINTFKSLGGTASLNEVYDFIAQTTARTLSQSWKSIVRGIIEDHSSDAAFRSGKDIFYSVGGKGSGRWALRNWPTEGVNYLSVFSIALPEEISDFQVFQEGAKKQITVNIYERNLVARQECIKYYGLNCLVCGITSSK